MCDQMSSSSVIDISITLGHAIFLCLQTEPYLKYNLHLYQTGQLVKFDIKKEFADSNDVCILHEWNSQLVCVWYHVDDDRKISSIKVIFDPRPFAAGAKQK
jgi:hypothetical protein